MASDGPRRLLRLLAGCLVTLACVGAHAASERRIALVIGNNNYLFASSLENAIADARAMKRELEARGFVTVYRENATRRVMNDAVEEFLGKLSTDAIAMVYYSGHGVQIRSENYLIPTDLQADKESDVAYDGLDLARLLDRLAQAQPRFSLVVLDACRDNPFHGRSIGGSRGLAPPASNAEGVMVVYAAGANQEALDRLSSTDSDPNGLFTREFIKAMRKPGLKVQDLVSEVKLAVIQQARSVGHTQTPAIYDQSVGTFVFSEGPASTHIETAGSSGTPTPNPRANQPAGVASTPAAEVRLASADATRGPRVDAAALAAALAGADAVALRSITASGIAPSVLEEALRQRTGDGKSSVARRFFENAAQSREATEWFETSLKGGLDPNFTLPTEAYPHEAVLVEALRAGNVTLAQALLRAGASPHPYQDLFLTASPRPRFLFPLASVADDDRLTLMDKQALARALLEAGVVIPRVVPPTGGSGWKSTMYEVNDLQEKVAPRLGLKLSPSPTLCERAPRALCQQASARTHEDWCAIVAATPKKLRYVYGKSSTSPLYDLTLTYLIAISGNRAYYLGLTRSIGWEYVLVEVSKDASSWTVLQMMSGEAGLGTCRKDESGYQPQECWRRIPLQRIPGTDEMRFVEWELSWKIAGDACAAEPGR